MWGKMKNGPERPVFTDVLAEGEGFEPSIRITVCRLSRAVHSTTLPPFQGVLRLARIGIIRRFSGNANTFDKNFTIFLKNFLSSWKFSTQNVDKLRLEVGKVQSFHWVSGVLKI